MLSEYNCSRPFVMLRSSILSKHVNRADLLHSYCCRI